MPNNNSWLYFLREFRKKHPKLKASSIMKQASKVYKKQPKKASKTTKKR